MPLALSVVLALPGAIVLALGSITLLGVIYYKVCREEPGPDAWQDVVETKVPRSFGRFDKERALRTTNDHIAKQRRRSR